MHLAHTARSIGRIALEELTQGVWGVITTTNMTAQRLKKIGVGLPQTRLNPPCLSGQSSAVPSPARIMAM
jgi:hypothetical protein